MKNISINAEETIRNTIKSKNINAVVLYHSQRIYMVENGLILSWDEFLEKHNNEMRDFVSVSGSLLSCAEYWKQRCLLAEKCLDESPCDPDITSNQIKAWNDYHKFKKLYNAE